MLRLLDEMLQAILLDGVKSLSLGAAILPSQVSFLAPDAPSSVPGTLPRLNVYLVDLRENLRLRSNERIEQRVGTTTSSRRAPYRVDCHYLISAVAQSDPSNPAPLEHALLYEATAALVHSLPLIPARVLAPTSATLAHWPEDQRDGELPMLVNPHEGFAKLGDFWNTMQGATQGSRPWQPAVYAVITAPVELLDGRAVELVRRRTTTYLLDTLGETYVEIGGTVFDRAVPGRPERPLGRAWVFASDGAVDLARTTTEDDGTFVLRVPSSATQIYAAAFGLGVTARLALGNTTADYTLRFT